MFAKLLSFLKQLEQRNIWYRLDSVRDAIMVEVTVPGEKWEIEFFEDGHIEVERFVSQGDIEGEGMLVELFKRYSD